MKKRAVLFFGLYLSCVGISQAASDSFILNESHKDGASKYLIKITLQSRKIYHTKFDSTTKYEIKIGDLSFLSYENIARFGYASIGEYQGDWESEHNEDFKMRVFYDNIPSIKIKKNGDIIIGESSIADEMMEAIMLKKANITISGNSPDVSVYKRICQAKNQKVLSEQVTIKIDDNVINIPASISCNIKNQNDIKIKGKVSKKAH